MHLVQHALIIGVAVDGGHETTLDTDGIVHHLGDGGETVGGAAGVGDDQIVRGQTVLIHAEHDGLADILGWRRDQHALGTGIQMRLGGFMALEEARALQHDVDAHVLVRQFAGIALAGHGDGFAVHLDAVIGGRHIATETAMGGVILKQKRIGLGIGQIVDRHQIQPAIGPLQNGARHQAADTPETVDRYFDCHGDNLLMNDRPPSAANGLGQYLKAAPH